MNICSESEGKEKRKKKKRKKKKREAVGDAMEKVTQPTVTKGMAA